MIIFGNRIDGPLLKVWTRFSKAAPLNTAGVLFQLLLDKGGNCFRRLKPFDCLTSRCFLFIYVVVVEWKQPKLRRAQPWWQVKNRMRHFFYFPSKLSWPESVMRYPQVVGERLDEQGTFLSFHYTAATCWFTGNTTQQWVQCTNSLSIRMKH